MSAPKLKIELPSAERGLAPDVIARHDRLKAKLGRRDLTTKQRQAAADELASLNAAPAKRNERDWLEAARAETEALAVLRGEQVERTKSGQIRIDRDPILSLMRAGHLTQQQFETALDFRAAYEAREAGPLTMQYGVPGGAHDNEKYVLACLKRAKAAQRIDEVERRILAECRDHPNALTVFRGVIGEGKALASFGKGRAFERNLRALRPALTSASSQASSGLGSICP